MVVRERVWNWTCVGTFGSSVNENSRRVRNRQPFSVPACSARVKCRESISIFIMADIEIYSTAACGYCMAAKNLLKSKGLAWRELRVDTDPAARAEMLHRAPGARTVPQIFINGIHVGGFDQLAAADRSGRLIELLQATP